MSYGELARLTATPLDKAVDKALGRINAEAEAQDEPTDFGWTFDENGMPQPRYPEGTPEYEAYAASLREALKDPHAFDYLFPVEGTR